MRWWPVLIAGAWLAGCAAPPDTGTVPVQSPEQREQALEQIDTWHLKGRVAIINGSEAWHLNMAWQQRQEDYRIELWGPFGSGRVRLEGDGQGVRLIDSDQGIYYADDPESLLYAHTGVKMPVSGLRYWILGMADPRYPIRQPRRDQAGRLTALKQADWQIAFSRYTRADGLALPDRLSVDRQDLRVKMVVDNWQVSASGS